MIDELGIEDGTKPEDGNGVHDKSPFISPVEPVGRLVVQDGLVLHDGDGEAAGDCEECDDHRQSKNAVFDRLVPESDHCPCLDHEHGLDENDKDEGQGVGHDAGDGKFPVDVRGVAGEIDIEMIVWLSHVDEFQS